MFSNSIRNAAIVIAVASSSLPWSYSAAQEVKVPNSSAGRMLEGWIKFMNANDDSPANNFNPTAFRDKTEGSTKSRTEFRNRGRQIFGKLGLARVVEEKGHEITVVLAGKEEQEILVTLFLVAKPDVLIDAVKIEPYRGGDPTQPPEQQSDTEIKDRLSVLMERAVRDGFSGAVLLARDSEPLFAEAYGLANRSYNIKNTIDTRFNLGSMNKMFTAVAIMQLVEKNKLALTDPISKYLDETWLSKKVASRVQIKHLLNHTSGLGNYFNQQFRQGSRAGFRNIADYKPLIVNEELAFDPGTSWQYSNTGFLLLGAIVEHISGTTYCEYVRANIYEPAGMSDSDSFELDSPTENLAYGYWKEEGPWKNNLFMHVIKGGPAGGGYSTLKDLLRFSDSLTSMRLVSPESTRTMVTPQPESPRYGFGFEVYQTPTGLVVGHSGGFPGIEANLSISVDKRIALVVLCNAEGSMSLVLDDIRRFVASMKD